MNLTVDVQEDEEVPIGSLKSGDGFRYPNDDQYPDLKTTYGVVIDSNKSFLRIKQKSTPIQNYPVYVVGVGGQSMQTNGFLLGCMEADTLVFAFDVSVLVTERGDDE